MNQSPQYTSIKTGKPEAELRFALISPLYGIYMGVLNDREIFSAEIEIVAGVASIPAFKTPERAFAQLRFDSPQCEVLAIPMSRFDGYFCPDDFIGSPAEAHAAQLIMKYKRDSFVTIH
jgi:hypothetical protein